MDVQDLIRHRVLKEGNKQYRAKEMTPEEAAERHIEMRRILKNTGFKNCSNTNLDNMTIARTEEGYIVEDITGHEFYYPNSDITAKESDFRRIRSMMPFEFINLTGKDFDWDKYTANVEKKKDIVNKYILKFPQFRDKGMGLYIFSGTKGSGKTMLSCCILNELAKRYVGSIKFVNTLDFLEMTKRGYKGEENEVQALYHAGVLVIDDIGVQMSKEWIETEFYRLINDRYVNRKPTIYTSNIPIDKLKMDDRVTDRIESTTYLISLPEESIRRKERQQAKEILLNEIENSPADTAISTGPA